jgi:predicted O-methyltransferase YrrM
MARVTTQADRSEIWVEVDRFVEKVLDLSDEALARADATSAAAGLPDHRISPNEGMLLRILAEAHGARKILELGTLGGYSAIWLARALPPGGHLVSLELDPDRAELARSNLAAAGVAGPVEVRTGDALGSLAALAAEGAGPFDFVFIDADKRRNPEYLGAVLELSGPGTLIFADNVVRAGAILESGPEDPILGEDGIAGLRRFYARLGADPRVTATVVQTVGLKGHDGFGLILVEGRAKGM